MYKLERFLGWWAYENLLGNFVELGAQKGISKSKTPITFNSFNISLKYDLAP